MSRRRRTEPGSGVLTVVAMACSDPSPCEDGAPAVHGKAGTGNEVVLHESQDRLGDIFGSALAAHERGGNGVAAFFLGKVRRQHYRARFNAINANAWVARAELDGKAACQRGDASLGGKVGRVVRVGPDTSPVA